LGIDDIPNDLEDIGDILNAIYDDDEISRKPLPPIQWSQKENTSIHQ
jgi:hypothetical protein